MEDLLNWLSRDNCVTRILIGMVGVVVGWIIALVSLMPSWWALLIALPILVSFLVMLLASIDRCRGGRR